MFANRSLTSFLLDDIYDLVAAALQNIIQITRGVMEPLGSNDEIHIRQTVDQLLSSTLRHAAHKTEHDIRAVPTRFRD